MDKLICWDIYEIATEQTSINEVMFRGRIRKLGLERWENILTENTQDEKGRVRFAIFHGEDPLYIIQYLKKIIPDITIQLVMESIKNPVLSKLKVNKEERYTL